MLPAVAEMVMPATRIERGRKDWVFVGPAANRGTRVRKRAPRAGIAAMAQGFAKARAPDPSFAAQEELDLPSGFRDGGTLFPRIRDEAIHHG